MTKISKLIRTGKSQFIVNLILVSMVFGYAHSYQGITGQVLSGLTGFLLGLLFINQRLNIWLNILTHGFIDTLTFTIFYLGYQNQIFNLN
jgi:uncharacterized protein